MRIGVCRGLVAVAGAALALLAPSAAGAASIVNGGFESGSLSGWQVYRSLDDGNWFAYSGAEPPIGGRRGAEPVQAPPKGSYAAIADEANPVTLILYQDVALEPGESHQLSLLAYYDSYATLATPAPNTLSVDEEALAGRRNQQFRIDVMRPTAPLESLEPGDVLLTLLQTRSGGPKTMQPTRLSADLTPFAGQTVRLRIAVAAHEEVLNAGVDAVRLTSSGPGARPGGGRAGGPGSQRLSLGRAKIDRRTGAARLPAHVPGPGVLKARGRGIEPARVRAPAAGEVTLRLRPTAAGRAKLRRRHRLHVRVTVTFLPARGSPETVTVPVVLKLV